jgi:hypothetical protein
MMEEHWTRRLRSTSRSGNNGKRMEWNGRGEKEKRSRSPLVVYI